MSAASRFPVRLAALPALIPGFVRLAARRRRWLAAALVVACAIHGTWRGVAVHVHMRDDAAWWSERFAASHGAMALANVIANLTDQPGEWSLGWSGDGRFVLRKGAAIRILPVAVTKADFAKGGDGPPAKVSLAKGEGSVPIVRIAGGSRSLCYNMSGSVPSEYLARRLEFGTYDGREWTWTPIGGSVQRIHRACEAMPTDPRDDGDNPPRLDLSSPLALGLRIGQPSMGTDAKAR